MFDSVIALDIENGDLQHQLKEGFDAIIHAAATVHGPREWLMQVTGLGTEALARAAINRGIPRLVHVSSTSIYGKVVTSQLSSETPVFPQTDYGVAKWAAECYLHHLQGQISSVSVRSPAIVGAQVGPHFLQRMRNLMQANIPVIRASHPDFLFNNVIHEDTLAEFLVRLAETHSDGFKAFPVGALQDVRLQELLSFMSEASNYMGQVVWLEEAGPPFSINLDDALNLGFRPLTALESIRRWTHDWH
jgi:nucleoside-diphosphate-sugar epimerase